jgi:molybdate transport system ATP-binding protein
MTPANAIVAKSPVLVATIEARVLRHDRNVGLSTLFFADGELRVPLVEAPIDAGVRVRIHARDVSISLSRPMDVSIVNRLPGAIFDVAPLRLPFVRVTLSLGETDLFALVTAESVERLALEPGLRAWAMVKAVALGESSIHPARAPRPRRWTVVRNSG